MPGPWSRGFGLRHCVLAFCWPPRYAAFTMQFDLPETPMLRPLAVLVLFVASVPFVRGQAPTDQDKMQGHWKLVRHEGSPPNFRSFAGKVTMEIKGDERASVVSGRVLPTEKFKLDATKMPKQIDILRPQKAGETETVLGIYELVDGRLRICTAMLPKADVRPVDFTIEPNNGRILMEYERKK